MPFQLVHQVAADIPRSDTEGSKIDKQALAAHFVEIYDYLWDYLFPSLGYEVGDVITGTVNPYGFGLNQKHRTVDYPVTDAAGYSDHTMHSIMGVSAFNGFNDYIIMLDQFRNISTTSPPTINQGSYAYSGFGRNNATAAQPYHSWLQTPANIFQDSDRPSDWFVTALGRIILWHVKPRVIIYDLIKSSARAANTRYDTWIPFGHTGRIPSNGGLNSIGTGGGTKDINMLTPKKGWDTDEAALYRDNVLTVDLVSSTYQTKQASIHSPNFRLFTPSYKDATNLVTPTVSKSSFGINTPAIAGNEYPYLRMRDNQGNWWIRAFPLNQVETPAIAFNCGTELPP